MARSDNKYRLKITRDAEQGKLSIVVLEGETEVESGEFSYNEIADSLKSTVALYGLAQLLQDRASDTPTGPGKLAEMKEVFANLVAGQFEKTRERGAPTVSAEVEALARLKQVSIPAIQGTLKNYTKEQREKILGNEKVKALAAEIRKEREQSEAVSLDDLAA